MGVWSPFNFFFYAFHERFIVLNLLVGLVHNLIIKHLLHEMLVVDAIFGQLVLNWNLGLLNFLQLLDPVFNLVANVY